MAENKATAGNSSVTEDYNSYFSGRTYLDQYYTDLGSDGQNTIENNVIQWLLKELKNPDHHSGNQTVLDFGCGPSLHLAFCLSRVYKQITLADYTANNRQEISLWLNNDEAAFDWSPFLSHISSMEGNITPADIEERTRKAIKEVLPCDVLQPNPLAPEVREPYDCIVTSLCLEACNKTLEMYRQSVKNLASLLKPKGTCLVAGVLGQTYYCVGEHKFFTLKLSSEDVKSAFRDAGFEDIKMEYEENEYTEKAADCSGSFCMYARKV